MQQINTLMKRLGLATIIFIILCGIFSIESIEQGHNKFFCVMLCPILNAINPHIYVTAKPEAPENQRTDWETTFAVYDKRKHGARAKLKSYRKTINPAGYIYKGIRDIALVPTLFLLSLFVTAKMEWKKKIWKFLLALLLFYIFMSLYLSYRFEFTINKDQLPLDSIWHMIITLFGFQGTKEPIYIFALFIWGVMAVPSLLKE